MPNAFVRLKSALVVNSERAAKAWRAAATNGRGWSLRQDFDLSAVQAMCMQGASCTSKTCMGRCQQGAELLPKSACASPKRPVTLSSRPGSTHTGLQVAPQLTPNGLGPQRSLPLLETRSAPPSAISSDCSGRWRRPAPQHRTAPAGGAGTAAASAALLGSACAASAGQRPELSADSGRGHAARRARSTPDSQVGLRHAAAWARRSQ